MQISRLFEMVYLLLERKNMTASELARRFEVSTRTIYRDVDTLAQAGIPIYTSKGKNGGIRLMEDFVLNKSVLSEEEQKQILTSLQSMNAIKIDGVQPVLSRLAALFGKERTDWVQIDFSWWNPENSVSGRFEQIKQAIFSEQIVEFDYSGMNGECDRRIVEPVKLVFKGADWYLLAFCRLRQDFRFFKLSRMEHVDVQTETFIPKTPPDFEDSGKREAYGKRVQVEVRIAPEMAYRVYDEFSSTQRKRLEDGSFLVSFEMVENDWMYGYFLAYGPYLEVLNPAGVRREFCRRLKKIMQIYNI
ncbi:helix-turn-helix transcriptional regulator [Diplocloster agilis]|uniref:helix-turn-helix transcriptional regulator n=1 Tax=Diplocloster agilis TaxID=2850323 RepID=UPI00082266D2|nr:MULTISPECIES: YafY family protein [Lachnospiraceae]MBU9746114.1 YafY family transcriptional regulator [Diplocloster agilis]MCU6732952.1 YafY family transcriptional regulator [Suonthocola fibrivorans]SCI67924.1 Proteasome accessory factor C [uncultured Clostridium sp.]